MKKIAFYIPSMTGGGAQKVIATLANNFASRGFQIDLLLTKAHGDFLDKINKDVKIIELSSKRVLFDIRMLTHYLNTNEPDVLISALTHANIIALISKSLCKSKTKVFITEHSNYSRASNARSRHETFIFNHLVSVLFKKSDGIIAVSNGSKEGLYSKYPQLESHIKVIYNPFDINDIKELSIKPNPHPWLAKSRSFKTLVKVGRLVEPKDHLTLLKSIKLLQSKIDMRLIIIGDGELKDELVEYTNVNNLNEIVDFYGFVDNPYALMSKADLLVSSSKYEGFSNVIVEALACGVPVVATDCPSGPSEILEDGKWGILVKPEDPEALARGIQYALENKDTAIDSISRAEDFSVEKIGNQYLDHIFKDRPSL